jgi:hypothetical protein
MPELPDFPVNEAMSFLADPPCHLDTDSSLLESFLHSSLGDNLP